jgi:PST family polysaccharide transporter
MRPFDSSGKFRPAIGDGGLARRAVRGAGVTVFSGGLGLAIQMIATVILVRLLTPADFGLMAMATTFSMLLLNFGLNGFTEATIQSEEMDHKLASNLFWINVCAGFLLTIGFTAAGSLLARFYGDSRVTHVTLALSATIFITSISVQHLALLKRAMRFSAVSANDLVARVASVAVSILFGWAGYGYWALVAGAITLQLSTSIGAWFLCRWIPGLPGSASGTQSRVWFAIHTYGRFTLNYFARNVDNILVGWRFGANSLGFYKKAYDLFALPAGQVVAPLTEVALSTLSRLNPRSVQYRQYFLSALSILAFVGMALAVDLTLVGKDLIRLLLGPKWEPAGRIFTFFGPGIGAMFIYHTHGWIHLSIGKADRWLRWVIVEVTVTVLLFLVALPWGPDGIAVAWAASFWILTIPAFWYAGKPIDFGIPPILGAVWKYVLAALLAGCVTVAIGPRIQFLAATSGSAVVAQRILVISLLFTGFYLSAVILLHRGCEPLYQFAWLLKEMVPWDKFSNRFTVVSSTADTNHGKALRSIGGTPKPMVSILIPAFNAQEWIADTLRSAIAQTWERKEIIVVDDGSTDQTLAIARQFESEGVHVVTQENQGAAAARNKAFSLSRGNYIQWLDADDLLARDKIARQMEVLGTCSKRVLLSSSFGRFSYRHYRAEFSPTLLWCDLSGVEWLLRKLGQNVYMQTATWLVSRELTEAAGPWDTRLLGDDDGEYFCRVLLASEGTRFVPEARVYYRAPLLFSLSYVGRSHRKIEAQWLSMQLHIRYLRSLEDTARVRAACLRYLHDNFIYFYPESVGIVRQMEQMATELGGHLEAPRLSWKYSWVLALFGWGPAKRLQLLAPRAKWTVKRNWDRLLYRIENQRFGFPILGTNTFPSHQPGPRSA